MWSVFLFSFCSVSCYILCLGEYFNDPDNSTVSSECVVSLTHHQDLLLHRGDSGHNTEAYPITSFLIVL